MVRRQHTLMKFQHLFFHRKRIRVPSEQRVRQSKVAHGRT
jgi:hypothetical protein